MELIYKNTYGACYKVSNAINPNCNFQMVISTVGIFMSENDIVRFLDIVRSSHEPCNCEECAGKRCNKIWTTNPLIDICLKVDDEILALMEDLISGTLFMLNIDDVLEEYRIG
jgi:hypothetical protein